MNDCAEGGGMAATASAGDCFLPPPPAYAPGPPQNMMMTMGPPYWANQQLLDMPPSTSSHSQGSGGSFQMVAGPDGFQPQTSNSLAESSLFNGGGIPSDSSNFQQQHFQDFQLSKCGGDANGHLQQFHDMDNFSPGGQNANGRFGGANGGNQQQNNGRGRQQLQQQQISSPSITSTADFLSNPSGQPQMMMPQQYDGFPQKQQQLPFPMANGFLGNNNCPTEANNTAAQQMMGRTQSDSPMIGRQSAGNQPPPSFPSPIPGQPPQMAMMGGQQRWLPPPQMMPMPPQPQMQQMDGAMMMTNGGPSEQSAMLPNGMPPVNANQQMMLPAMPNGHPNQQQFPLGCALNGMSPRFPPAAMMPPMNGRSAAMIMGSPPQMVMLPNGAIGPLPPQFGGRRSFLFNSNMANKAAQDIQQHQAPDMARWHLHSMQQWHMQNPSTSRANFEISANAMANPPAQQGKSPNPTSTTTTTTTGQSRAAKRKASAQAAAAATTSADPPHSMNSPAMSVPGGAALNHHQMMMMASNSTVGHFGNPQSVPPIIDGHVGGGALAPSQRHSSVDICDSSTNNDPNGALFKRPPSRMPSQPGVVQMPNYMSSPNVGQQMHQQPSAKNCFGRMDDENPLKKMEIMTSKTLNEQPANKMSRLMGADEAGMEQDQAQQQQNINLQEKRRKLHSIEKELSQFTSDTSIQSPQPGQATLPKTFGGPPPPHPAALIQMGPNGFAGPAGYSPLPPGIDPNQLPAQFRPVGPPFFAPPGGQMPMNPDCFGPAGAQPQQNSPSASSFPSFGHERFPHPAQMRVLPNGMHPNQQQAAVFHGAMGPADAQQLPNGFPMQPPNNFWMPSAIPPQPIGGGVQSLEGLESRVPSLKMQHMPNGQQQIMAGGTNGNGGGAGGARGGGTPSGPTTVMQ